MAKNKKVEEPEFYTSRINNQVINYNVYVMSKKEKLMYILIMFAVGGLVGLVYYGGLFMKGGKPSILTFIFDIVVFAVVGIFSSKIFLPVICEKLRVKRINNLKKQFCDFLSALSTSLSGGMNMTDALQAVHSDLSQQYSADSMIIKELDEIIGGMNNNIPIEDMISDFGNRCGIPDVKNFAVVFETCYRTGGDIKEIVKRTSAVISEKVMVGSEIETAMTSNKMQANIMNIIPIVMIVIMRVMSSEFAESFGSLLGVIGLTVSAALTFSAYKLGQKIMNVEG